MFAKEGNLIVVDLILSSQLVECLCSASKFETLIDVNVC